MRKVLLTTMSLDIGGAETHIIELARELKRRGIDVSVASNGGVYVAELEQAGIPHHTVPMDKRKLSSMLQSYFLLRKIIKREKPDIVHAHARIPGFICGLLHKTMKFTFITTAHGVFDLGRGLKYLTNWGEKTIAASDDIKRYLIDNYGIEPDNIFVTINAIDSNRFSPEVSPANIISEFGLDPTRPIICNVNRLDNPAAAVSSLLIDLAPELNQRLPGVQIVIAGGGDVYDTLKANADAANAAIGANAVIMTGPRTDINEILAACDVFVGVARSAMEAMATAKPVIIAGAQGYIGLLTPDNLQMAADANFTGRGCALPTSELLLRGIIDFFSNVSTEDRISLGNFGRDLISRDYSISRMTDDCIHAYEAAERRRYHVVMSGYYGFKNAGDEAILQSIYRNIKHLSNDISITVLSSDPDDTKTRYGYAAVDRFKILRVLGTLRRCDLLVSGGGSLLQDFTSTRSLLYYLFIIWAAKKMGKKVMIYANGIGPVSKKSNRRRVRRVVSRADVITLRDPASLDELRAMGVIREDMHVTADPVFTISGVPSEDARHLLSEHGVPEGAFIAVSIRPFSAFRDSQNTDFCQKIAAICDRVAETSGHHVVFIPMQANKDIAISRKVQEMMKNPSYILESRFTAEALMGVIGQADCMLAMRLHALIFAARMNVPFAGLVYDPKVAALSESLSMPSAGDVTDLDCDLAQETIANILSQRDYYSEILKSKSDALELAAREDSALLLDLLREN
ncbi:MAG: polysaccharide pyruvyl transferase CsaB [Oscillospiraceae bacterium]|nr:polysaccharide pyruvyl transferase CsaB [Oscillospiraceae bacterium]